MTIDGRPRSRCRSCRRTVIWIGGRCDGCEYDPDLRRDIIIRRMQSAALARSGTIRTLSLSLRPAPDLLALYAMAEGNRD